MTGFTQDLRYAIRSLHRSSQITIASVICIAIGIGINAVTFGLTNAVVLRAPPGVASPERVVRLHFDEQLPAGAKLSHTATSYPTYQAIGTGVRAFQSVAAYFATDVSFGASNSTRRLTAVFASGTYFPTLGVRPVLGNALPQDDRASAPVAVLSYRLWNSQFGRAATTIGSVVRVNGRPVTVVGVAPRGFGGTDLQPADIWLPVSLVDRAGPGSDWMASRFASWLTVIARLAANVDRQQAAGYATVLLGDVTAGQPPTVFAGGLNGNSAPEEARQRSTLLWVTAAALLVLSIACVNVALLLLARGERRTHEISLRLALGASRWRVVRQLLVESALLALVGMLVGGLSLLWGESVARLLGMPSSAGFVDQQVVIFVAGTALVASFGFGIAPAYQAVRVALRSALSADPERAGGRRSRGKRLLIAAQVALSFMLLVTAATFVATLREAQHIDVGADVDHLLLVSTPASGEGLPIDAAWKLFTTLRDRVVELPGVASAALASAVPFVSTIQVPVRLPDVETSGMALVNNVGLEYRSTIGARLLAGRWFTAADTLSKDPVAIISLQMARQFWPAGGAVGKCFHVSDLSSPCTRVIGVTEDAKYTDVHADPAPLFYLLARGRLTAMPSLLVRTSGGADGSRERIWRSLQESSSSNPYLEVTPFRSLVGTQLLQLRNGSALFLCFALLSLCLSCFGLFGLLSFMVARRSREFGVRQAMGATRKDLIFLVLFDSARTVGAGMICGTLLAVGVVRVLSQSLGLQNVYPIAYLLVMAVLGGAAAVASCIPALRAARTPPAWALRQS